MSCDGFANTADVMALRLRGYKADKIGKATRARRNGESAFQSSVISPTQTRINSNIIDNLAPSRQRYFDRMHDVLEDDFRPSSGSSMQWKEMNDRRDASTHRCEDRDSLNDAEVN